MDAGAGLELLEGSPSSKMVSCLEPWDLSFGDFDVINTLRRGDPGGSTPTDLARSALITSGAVSARLDRLEDRDLIRRTPHPTDRRGVLVTLSAQGERLADEALGAVLDTDRAFLEPLTAAQRRSAASLPKRLLRSCEQQRVPRSSPNR